MITILGHFSCPVDPQWTYFYMNSSDCRSSCYVHVVKVFFFGGGGLNFHHEVNVVKDNSVHIHDC